MPHDDLVTVVCTDTAPSVNWQCQVLIRTWRRVGQAGSFLRLVAAADGGPLPDHLDALVVRTDAWNVHPDSGDHYPPYNRLLSLLEWLDRDRPDVSVLILDPDMVFRHAVRPRATRGTAVTQPWIDFGRGAEASRVVATASGTTPEDLPAVTWPAILHADDLLRILPRWIELTAAVRDRVGIWESDMYGFVGALAEDGMELSEQTLAAWMNWPEESVAGAPIIHYCQTVEAHDGRALWSKRVYRPWDPIAADPAEARLDYCRDLLGILSDVVAEKRRSGRPVVGG